MKILIRYISILFVLGSGVAAHAQQMTFTVADVTKVSETQWKYGTVTCASQNPVTSIILSMVNNQVASNSSGISPTRTITSLGNNPRTILYLFTPALSSAQVENFIEGATFEKTTEIPETNHTMNISVDANPTSLPGEGSTITAWAHPDGSIHYYVWVNTGYYNGYMQSYNAAKNYYFQGMRGYLSTITSKEENTLLTNISTLGGWSGGVRTGDIILDPQSLATQPTSSNPNFKWLCGPEVGFEFYQGPGWTSTGAGPMAGAYSGWPPVGGQPDASPSDEGVAENCMQINFHDHWNDLQAPEYSRPTNDVLTGYFIEFGGNGEAYSVGAATYPANPNYTRPTVATTNDQWYDFAPGNEASTSTILKRGPLRVRTMILK